MNVIETAHASITTLSFHRLPFVQTDLNIQSSSPTHDYKLAYNFSHYPTHIVTGTVTKLLNDVLVLAFTASKVLFVYDM